MATSAAPTHCLPEGRINWQTLGPALACDLAAGLDGLEALYEDLAGRNRQHLADVELPCHRGCAMCCHESVFLTPLEFLYAWRWLEMHHSAETRAEMIARGLSLYAQHEPTISALLTWPPEDPQGRLQAARTLRFACPMLDAAGGCRIYPARELLARLFGASFNAQGGVYGCHLVGQQLRGKTLTLVSSEGFAARLRELPLTSYRQVYPYFIFLFFGEGRI